MRSLLITSLLAVAVASMAAALAVAAWLWLGGFDATAASPPSRLAYWPLNLALARQAESGAAKVPDPPPPTRRRVVLGFRQYDADCSACHGTPAASRALWAKSMNPQPPDLTATQSRWPPKQLFWLICHGVKMTGMPAFGAQHTDDEIWDLTLFVSALPKMSAGDYQRLHAAYGPAPTPFSLTPNAACLTAK
jgi:mono/diheme cytochrome c family protein